MSDQLTRGDLPHWYRPGYAHFITYRLAQSIPVSMLRALRLERQDRLNASVPKGMDIAVSRERIHKIMFAKYDRILDQPSSANWLADSRVGEIIRDNLYHHRGTKYELLSYCVMPNHVHLMLQPFESALVAGKSDAGSGQEDLEIRDSRGPLSGIMHSLKSYTANRANEVLGRTGQFWQKESYDHWIRDVDELKRIVEYIAANPVRAGLCRRAQDWRFSSSYDRFVHDGSDCGLVGWLRDDWQR